MTVLNRRKLQRQLEATAKRITFRHRRETCLHRALKSRFRLSSSSSSSLESITELIRSDPTATGAVDGGGNTALHVACANILVSVEIVEALLEANVGAVLERDRRGRTPLHRACGSGGSREEIVGALLAPQTGWKACSLKDKEGQTPLHAAASQMFSASSQMLGMLLRSDPSVVLMEDKCGDTPFAIFCKGLRRARMQANDAALITGKPAMINCTSVLEKAVPFVKAVMCISPGLSSSKGHPGRPLSKCGSFDIEDENAWENMLHHTIKAIEYSGIMIDPKKRTDAKHLLLSVLAQTREQANIKDEDGNLPLHIAARAPFLNDVTLGEKLAFPSKDCTFIDGLVEANQEAAHTLDGEGELLFHILTRNGAKWKQGVMTSLQVNPNPLKGIQVEPELMPRVLARAGEDLGFDALFKTMREKPELFIR